MKFGKTWWGEKWLESLNNVYFSNRLPRGKRYANSGKVKNIEINNNKVSAQVIGKYTDYYITKIKFQEFTKAEKEKIEKIIYDNPSILSALLNHKLPVKLYDELKKEGIEVFPSSWDSFKSSCSCPDYAPICKHIAGLMYMLSHEIDKNPFQIFNLHNFNLENIIEYKETEEKINTIDELLLEEKELNTENLIEEVDFSKIPNSLNNILFLLKSEPIFFEKDFKEIIKNLYKSTSKYAKNIQKPDTLKGYNEIIRLDNKNRIFDDEEENYDNWINQTFINKWEKPQKWNKLEINLNKNYEIKNINIGLRKKPFNKKNSNIALFGFLTELENTTLHNFNEDIQFLQKIYQFTLSLIENNSIIPELFKLDNGKYKIRWIPAIFDENINKIYEKLANESPENILKYEKKNLNPKQTILTLVSILIEEFLVYYKKLGITKKLETYLQFPVFQLFLGTSQDFNEYKTKGYENLINQWLSKFTLEKRDYNLYLIITEDNEEFDIDVQVSINDKTPEYIGKVIERSTDEKLRLNLIEDSYLINDLLPEFNKSIDNNDDITLDLKDFSSFFINILPLFELMGISIILPKNLEKTFKPELNVKVDKNNNEVGYLSLESLGEFNWEVAIGDTILSPADFEQLVKNSEGLVKIANKYVVLDKKEVKTLIKRIDKISGNLSQNEVMQLLLSGELDDIDVNIDDELEEMIKNITKIDDINVPRNLNANLREYQKTGFSWLVQNIKTGFGSILADDMGLGKTIQVLTTILYLKEEGKLDKEKVLIVVPTSLLTNWKKEIETFTPDLNAHIYHGPNREFPKKDYDIILTSYGILRSDKDKFSRRKWFLKVIDEAQNIKNPVAKQTKAVKSIKAKHKIALSGTPVENRLSEYWSIFDFTNKGYLTGIKKFRDNYIIPIEKDHSINTLNRFKNITKPFILRRLKTDKKVIKDLPDKIVNDIYCNLTPQQSALYQQTLDLLLNRIEEQKEEEFDRKGIVFKLITALKQICNHPSQYIKSDKYSIDESGKMEVLMNILENIIESNEKVLIFTQYVQMGNILKDLIEDYFDCEVLFLTGSLSPKKRDKLIDKFQNNSQNQIFILSLKAGGTGLNLTAAQNVIHYDLWWNPAVENQATDRAYRIGQTENVMVYRFITLGTFEEKINEMIKEKEELAELTVGSGETFITEMSNKELKDMLRLR